MQKNFQKSAFTREATSVLLAAFISIEIYSLLSSWLRGRVTPSLAQNGVIFLTTSIVLGIIGLCGLLARKRVSAYFSLLSVTIGAILNCQHILKATLLQGIALSFTRQIASIILGLAVIAILFHDQVDQENSVDPHSSNSDAEFGDLENQYVIETRNLVKKYFLGSNVINAVNGIDLKIRRGEFVSIMGPSGSGKSTLLNLLGALDKPTSGKVLIDGVDISQLDDKGLAKLRNEKIGFVFQAYNLIARSTVKRNMELPALVKGCSKEERMRKIKELLSIVGLSDKMYRKPTTLSGGEQQRVAIARALMNDPDIILADEPTGNVDSKTGRVIMNFFRRLNRERGTTMVVVTHDPEVARMTDRIIYIRDGRIFREEYLREEST